MRTVKSLTFLTIMTALYLCAMAQNPRVVRDIAYQDELQPLDIVAIHNLGDSEHFVSAKRGDGPIQFYQYREGRGLVRIQMNKPELIDQEWTFAYPYALIRGGYPDQTGVFFYAAGGLYFYNFQNHRCSTIWETVEPHQIEPRDLSIEQPLLVNWDQMEVATKSSRFALDEEAALVDGDRFMLVQPRTDGEPGMRVTTSNFQVYFRTDFDFTPDQAVVSTGGGVFIYREETHQLYQIVNNGSTRWTFSYEPDETFLGFHRQGKFAYSMLQLPDQRVRIRRHSDFTSTHIHTLPAGRTVLDIRGYAMLTRAESHLEFYVSSSDQPLFTAPWPNGEALIYYDWIEARDSFAPSTFYLVYLFANGEGKIVSFDAEGFDQQTLATAAPGQTGKPQFWLDEYTSLMVSDFENRIFEIDLESQDQTLRWQPDGLVVNHIQQGFIEENLGYESFIIDTNEGRLNLAKYGPNEPFNLDSNTAYNGSSFPAEAFYHQGKWYFWASRALDDQEETSLYVSDGTVAGTIRLYDALSAELHFETVAAEVYAFVVNPSGAPMIIATDGTVAGTREVYDISNFSGSRLPLIGEWLVWQWRNFSSSTVYHLLNLRTLETFEVETDFSVSNEYVRGNQLLLHQDSGVNHRLNFETQEAEPLESPLEDAINRTWRRLGDHYYVYTSIDGERTFDLFDADSLQMVDRISITGKDLYPSISIQDLIKLHGSVYMLTSQPQAIWEYNESLHQFQINTAYSGFSDPTALFQTANGWIMSKNESTYPYRDMQRALYLLPFGQTQVELLGRTSDLPIFQMDDGILFTAASSEIGREFWFSNGTFSGTVPLDVEAGDFSHSPRYGAQAGQQIFYSGFHTSMGREPSLLCFSPNTAISASQLGCMGNQATLSVPDAGPGANYTWIINGASIESGAGSRTVSILPSALADITAEITVSTPGGCANTGTLTLPVANALPSAPDQISGPDTVCQGSVVTFSVVNPVAQAYQWQVPDGGLLLGGQGTPTIEVAIDGPITWVEVVASNGCGISDSLRHEFADVSVVDAGPDQFLCDETSTQLTAVIHHDQTGQWFVRDGQGGTFSDATDPTTQFSGQSGEIYVLEWVTNSTCGEASDFVVIRMSGDHGVAVDTPLKEICDATSTTITGTEPIGTAGEWQIVSGEGGSFYNANSARTSFRGQADSEYQLEWRVMTPGCGLVAAPMTVRFGPSTVNVQAGEDQFLALGEPIHLDATKAAISRGRWRVLQAPANANVSFSDPTNAHAELLLGNPLPGTYQLEWQEYFGDCLEDVDRVSIHIFAPGSHHQNLHLTNLGASASESFLITDEAFFFVQRDTEGTLGRLKMFDFATRETTDLGLEVRFLSALHDFHDEVLIQVAYASYSSVVETYRYNKTTTALTRWSDDHGYELENFTISDQYATWWNSSTGLHVLKANGETAHFALGGLTLSAGRLSGQSFLLLSYDQVENLLTFHELNLQTGAVSLLTEVPTSLNFGLRYSLVDFKLLDNQMLVYIRQSGTTPIYLIPLDDPASFVEHMEHAEQLITLPGGDFLVKGQQPGDDQTRAFLMDAQSGALTLTPWQHEVMDDPSATFFVHGNYIYAHSSLGLFRMTEGDSQVSPLFADDSELHHAGYDVPGQTVLVTSRRASNQGPYQYTLKVVDETNGAVRVIDLDLAQDEFFVRARLVGEYIAVYYRRAESTNNGFASADLRLIPSSELSTAQNIAVAGNPCSGGNVTLTLTAENATDISWDVSNATFYSYSAQSVTVSTAAFGTSHVYVTYTNGEGQRVTESIQFEPTTNLERTDEWGQVGSQVRMDALVEDINSCSN